MKRTYLAIASAVILGLSACGSPPPSNSDTSNGPSETSAAEQEESTDTDETANLKEFFDAYASSEPEAMRQAASSAAQDSTAQKYMTHQANIVEANDATGYERYVQQASYDDGKVSICYEGDECGEFADLTFEDGKLASFTVDGNDITERIVLGDESVVKYKDVAGFEVLSSYQTVEGSLMAVVRFYAYERPISFSYTATYRKPSGQQIDSSESELPSRVGSDSNQDAIAIFPNSENGGDLHLKFATDDDEDEVAGDLIVETVEVPLPKA